MPRNPKPKTVPQLLALAFEEIRKLRRLVLTSGGPPGPAGPPGAPGAPGAPGSSGTALIGYSKASTNQTGITTATDLTDLSVTLTPAAGRNLYIVCCVIIQMSADSSGDAFNVSIQKDGVTEAFSGLTYRAGGTPIQTHMAAFVDVDPTNASHTYKLTGGRQSGTGTYLVRTNEVDSAIYVFDAGATF